VPVSYIRWRLPAGKDHRGGKAIQARGNMASIVRSPRVSRQTLYAIAALAAVAVVVLAGVTYYLDVHRYPSEDTPLNLQPWGISFVRERPNTEFDSPPPPFANITLTWSEGWSHGAAGSPMLSTLKRLNVSDFSLPDDLASYVALNITGWESDDIINGVRVIGPSGIFITDYDGDGLFDYGDAVSLVTCIYEDGVLTHQGYYPNTVYMFALNAHGGAGHDDPWQFKYAIHHGDLYAWEYHWYTPILDIGH
jgi:hypothetical protein